MKRVTALLALATLLVTTATAAAKDNHIKATLAPVNGSGVSGSVQLHQVKAGGTRIEVHADGLKPGNQYVSLYYDTNTTCQLEPYSIPDDEIGGGPYTANAAGHGHTEGTVDANLDEVLSVSVRRNADFKLLACAKVH